MDRRILDEEISRRIAKALDTKAKFLVRIDGDMTNTLESDFDETCLACQRDCIYWAVANTLMASSVAETLAVFSKELAFSAQRIPDYTLPGRYMMAHARVKAIAEAVVLLQAVQEEVEQAA